MKLAWATKPFEKAGWVLVGVPDESGSHSYRKGSSKAPKIIRKISNQRYVFKKGKETSLVQSQYGNFKCNLHDYGDIKRKEIQETVNKILKKNKKPFFLGGDHSITFPIVKEINKFKKPVSVIYFDAHPDIVCSPEKYYGSVVCDINKLKNFSLKKSVEIGIRAAEKEEFKNLKKIGLKTITPLEITERGVKNICKDIKNKVGNNIYLSIDMDSLDPSVAPGVSTPVPGGLSSSEFFYLVNEVSKLNLIGVDITEISPKYDLNDMTSDLVAKTILEIISK